MAYRKAHAVPRNAVLDTADLEMLIGAVEVFEPASIAGYEQRNYLLQYLTELQSEAGE